MKGKAKDRIAVLLKEHIDLVPHDPKWAEQYAEVETVLKRVLPRMLAQRIAHIGSTAIPGISAKPIIDVQVEVSDMERVKEDVVPLMEEEGYEFIWRPTIGDAAPFYAWFIKRDEHGERAVHVHMVEPGQASVNRLIFRDYLCHNPEEATRYEALKLDLVKRYPNDRGEYTKHKTKFVKQILSKARKEKMRR